METTKTTYSFDNKTKQIIQTLVVTSQEILNFEAIDSKIRDLEINLKSFMSLKEGANATYESMLKNAEAQRNGLLADMESNIEYTTKSINELQEQKTSILKQFPQMHEVEMKG